MPTGRTRDQEVERVIGLGASGPLGRLLARQAEAHRQDWDMAAMGRAHAGLPDDLLNFQYDRRRGGSAGLARWHSRDHARALSAYGHACWWFDMTLMCGGL
jgi:hypothetical protein